MRFVTSKSVQSLSRADLERRLSLARTFVMYGHTQKLRGEAMEAVELIRSELRRRGVEV